MLHSTTCCCLAQAVVRARSCLPRTNFAGLVDIQVALEVMLCALSFDAVTWDLLQAGSHWAWKFGHLEWCRSLAEETRGRLAFIALSRLLSLGHILVTTFHFGIYLGWAGMVMRPYVASIATRVILWKELK